MLLEFAECKKPTYAKYVPKSFITKSIMSKRRKRKTWNHDENPESDSSISSDDKKLKRTITTQMLKTPTFRPG